MQDYKLLLSIHEGHAENILSGTKRVELRKSRPRVSKGERVLMYISSPVKALIGYFVVEKVVEDIPSNIWKKYGEQTGISKGEFNQYYEFKKQAYAIVINDAQKFSREITLECLRETVPDFHPPQSYRYVNKEELSLIGI